MPYVQGGTSQGNSGRPEVADVYHSPTVFANFVPIALWQDPQGGAAASYAAVLAEMSSPTFDNDQAIQSLDGNDDEAAVVAQQKKLVEAGVITQGDLDKGNNATPSQSNTTPSAPPGDINTGTDITVGSDVDNTLLYDSPNTGIKYYVKTVTKQPGVVFPYDVATVASQNGFTVDEVVKNLQLLVINCFDPIKKQFPDAFMTCSFRADKGYSASPHKSGSACDIQFSSASKADYYTRAQWVKDNVKFDQFLLEYKTTGTKKPWLHLGINSKAAWRQQVCTFMNDKNCKGPGVVGLYDLGNVD